MGRGAFFTTLIVMFALFLSMISIVFDLSSLFFVIELGLLLILMLWGLVGLAGIVFEFDIWKGLLLFYMINLVNLIVVYFLRLSFKEIMLPFAVCYAGFILALVKSGEEESL